MAPRLASDHFALRKRAAVLGLGVSMLPEVFALPEIEAGRLVPVLPGWRFQFNHLQAVYVSQRGLCRRCEPCWMRWHRRIRRPGGAKRADQSRSGAEA